MNQAGNQIPGVSSRLVTIGAKRLEGMLSVPEQAAGLIIFAHGSGSSRHSPRNTYVAERLQSRGMATLLFDLLTVEEASDRRNVFHIPLLASRLQEAVAWTDGDPETAALPLGLFGASTGSAAALVAAAAMPERIAAVVSRGGRPDLAEAVLSDVRAPTLLIVGGDDTGVLELNRSAFTNLNCVKRLLVVPGATHLFEESGALDQVVDAAAEWFVLHLPGKSDDFIRHV
jgi:putative phosphoribosyl transferase